MLRMTLIVLTDFPMFRRELGVLHFSCILFEYLADSPTMFWRCATPNAQCLMPMLNRRALTLSSTIAARYYRGYCVVLALLDVVETLRR